jgi:hypothetical protein
VPIRDPTNLTIITEANPFADPGSLQQSSSDHSTATDEHGRLAAGRARQDNSQSSAYTSSTSLLEEIGNKMNVQHRVRTASGSITSQESPLLDSAASSIFGSRDAIEEEVAIPGSSSSGAVVWAGEDTTPMVKQGPLLIDTNLAHSPITMSPISPTPTTSPSKIRRVPISQTSGVMSIVGDFERRAAEGATTVTSGPVKRKSVKVEMVPRETLFVANPDGS